MLQESINQYKPNYYIHPGEILEEVLEENYCKKREFANRCGVSAKTISQIINCKSNISPEMALIFERVLGISAELWINLDTKYRLFEARQNEIEKFSNQIEWINKFPLKELVKRGYLPHLEKNTNLVGAILSFFKISDISNWEQKYNNYQISYRKSTAYKKNCIYSLASWIRIVENKAELIDVTAYSKTKFLNSINKIRELDIKNFAKLKEKIIKYCSDAGVAIIFEPEISKTHVSGATFWARKDKAVIGITLRYKSDDHFWFTLFHEFAHILLHSKKEIFIDDEKSENIDTENEANEFAKNILIAPKKYERFISEGHFTASRIKEFAEKINISPGVIVGRLQKEGLINYNRLNNLKNRVS